MNIYTYSFKKFDDVASSTFEYILNVKYWKNFKYISDTKKAPKPGLNFLFKTQKSLIKSGFQSNEPLGIRTRDPLIKSQVL